MVLRSPDLRGSFHIYIKLPYKLLASCTRNVIPLPQSHISNDIRLGSLRSSVVPALVKLTFMITWVGRVPLLLIVLIGCANVSTCVLLKAIGWTVNHAKRP